MTTATPGQIHTAVTDHYAEAARTAADGGTAGIQEFTETLYPTEQRDELPEQALTASGLPTVLLRNSWYTENYTAALTSAVERGALVGAAGAGRIAAATRADYAEAAAAVLTVEQPQAGRVYELTGDLTTLLGRLTTSLHDAVTAALRP